MTSKEKIKYVLEKIRERARISPSGFFHVDCTTLVDGGERGIPDKAPVLISQDEQVSILRKMKEDGLLFSLDFDDDYRGAWITLMSLDREGEENPYEARAKEQLIELRVVGGKLVINPHTGFVRLNEVESDLNPKSKAFKILLTLATSPNKQATYAELIGSESTKDRNRTLVYSTTELKTALGILPKSRAVNKDIIGNIPRYGYKLLTS